jgi:hypothetical protein
VMALADRDRAALTTVPELLAWPVRGLARRRRAEGDPDRITRSPRAFACRAASRKCSYPCGLMPATRRRQTASRIPGGSPGVSLPTTNPPRPCRAR